MLGEPTNDLDTDTLAAMEDLLDRWPGTLIVVSHDRYLLERVTDHQVALLGDGKVRALPGGVEQYLAIRETAEKSMTAEPETAKTAGQRSKKKLSGAERRAAEKELASLERRIERLQQQAVDNRAELADLDQSDYQRLSAEMAKITALEDEAESLEERWLELSTLLE